MRTGRNIGRGRRPHEDLHGDRRGDHLGWSDHYGLANGTVLDVPIPVIETAFLKDLPDRKERRRILQKVNRADLVVDQQSFLYVSEFSGKNTRSGRHTTGHRRIEDQAKWLRGQLRSAWNVNQARLGVSLSAYFLESPSDNLQSARRRGKRQGAHSSEASPALWTIFS